MCIYDLVQMLVKELIKPNSIVVVGGSKDLRKPGGKVVANLINGTFQGSLYVLNPKETEVQGIKSFQDMADLPDTDCAILAIAAKYCYDTIKFLCEHKKTKGFIILSAGFSEEGPEGAKMEEEISRIVSQAGGSLIGPNCIGVINQNYQGVFTSPVPNLYPGGCDFISGSGATAVFIMETAMPNGLTFSSIYSVGNSAQVGVEEVLQYMDETFDPQTSSKVKLLYLEQIHKPQLLLKHASSLIRKGCRIAAIKAGVSEAGSRAASSHTGALAGSDTAADALLRKAGIVRCFSRAELAAVGSVFMHKKLEGGNIAIITHAGGPAVMLTDALAEGGLHVPPIESAKKEELLEKLHPGSSVANPIDFLATGTAEQLELIIDYCETHFDEVDGMIVIFGSPGLFPVDEVYEVLDNKMRSCRKTIFPVLPSVINAEKEIKKFQEKGRINFPDEVLLGTALAKAFYLISPVSDKLPIPDIDHFKIRSVIEKASDGFLPPEKVCALLDAAKIPRVKEWIVTTEEQAIQAARESGYPVVMKVAGPIHKTEMGGVVLDVRSESELSAEYLRMIRIEGASGIIIQPLLSGLELFAGLKLEPGYGHLVMCGLGGIFVEVLKDVTTGLSPLTYEEAMDMIGRLQGRDMLGGVRGQDPVDEKRFAEILVRLSALVESVPEIEEMDINPLIGKKEEIVAVDARIRIKKS